MQRKEGCVAVNWHEIDLHCHVLSGATTHASFLKALTSAAKSSTRRCQCPSWHSNVMRWRHATVQIVTHTIHVQYCTVQLYCTTVHLLEGVCGEEIRHNTPLQPRTHTLSSPPETRRGYPIETPMKVRC